MINAKGNGYDGEKFDGSKRFLALKGADLL